MSEEIVLTEKLLSKGLEIILYVAPLVEHASILARHGEHDRAAEKYKEAEDIRHLINEKYA